MAVRERHAGGESYSRLAEELEISSQRVGQIIHALNGQNQYLENIGSDKK